MTEDLNRTALYNTHLQLKAKMVPFGGWNMPVQYTGITEEHQVVRQKVGLFDISHMGTFLIEGPSAFDFLQSMVPNDLARITPGKGLYTQFCREDGGILDDLILYQLGPDQFQLVVNAGNRTQDFQWLDAWRDEQKQVGLRLQDLSSETCIIALQGPQALPLINQLASQPLTDLPYFGIGLAQIAGSTMQVARTGYTGEDGFELFVPADAAEHVWQQCLEHGQAFGLQPVGLGARDTLRLEAAMPLYGHDLTTRTTPLEAALGWSVALQKTTTFLGQAALQQQKSDGVQKKRVGFRLPETKRAPRQEYKIMFEGQQVGEVTSGSLSPTLGYPIGMGYLIAPWFQELTTCEVDIRGQLHPAEIVKLPFYRRTK